MILFLADCLIASRLFVALVGVRTNTTRWRTSFHSIQITSVGDRRDMRLRSLTPPLVAGCYDSSRSISNPSSLHNSTSCINSATTTAAAVGAPTSVSRRGSAGGILGNGLLARPSAIANNRLEKVHSTYFILIY
jgi:hypothetical protein